jgi:DNA polymerase-1
MIPASLEAFQTILIIDTEYVAYGSDQVRVYPRAEIQRWHELPFPTGPDVLAVVFNAAAESGFLHVLGVGMPVHWLDLMVENRALRNVCLPKRMLREFEKRHPEMLFPNRNLSLLKTAEVFGVEGGDAGAKDAARELIVSRVWEQGDPEVWRKIVEYCAEDVRLTAQLFTKMVPHLELRPALIRGRYAAEHGRMTQRGIPVDMESYERLQRDYQRVLDGYRVQVDPERVRLTPKGKVSQRWLPKKLATIGALETHACTPKGRPSTKAQYLAETAERYQDDELRAIAQWMELLTTFPESKEGRLRLSPLGKDGRIRYHQFAFATHTGRALGLGKEALMQLPAWMRGLVQPKPGEVLLQADYAAQEVAIAAGLSRDEHLRAAYEAGDPYRQIAVLSGVLTAETEAEQARKVRRLFKSLVLGRFYGMSLLSFRRRSGIPYTQAARVWQFFDRRFTKFSDWQARTVARAQRQGWIRTRYGWKAQVYSSTKVTTLLNWSIQAAGADVLRLATILLVEAGFEVLTTCHDSLLLSVPEEQVEAGQAELVRVMQGAGEIAVGIPIRVDVQVVKPGERLLTADTRQMWERVMSLLGGTRPNQGSTIH